jgi:hypothetical protein
MKEKFGKRNLTRGTFSEMKTEVCGCFYSLICEPERKRGRGNPSSNKENPKHQIQNTIFFPCQKGLFTPKLG